MLHLHNQDINWADNVKYLGVGIDKQLNMHPLVSQTIKSLSRALNTIKVMSSLAGVNSKILHLMVVLGHAWIMGQSVLICEH